jgi:hypothetical protein
MPDELSVTDVEPEPTPEPAEEPSHGDTTPEDEEEDGSQTRLDAQS